MQASLPYNAEWLISHYSLLALVYWSILPDRSTAMLLLGIPIMTATLAWAFSSAQHLTWWSHLVLAGVAHSVFLGMRNLLRFLRRPNGSIQVGKVPSMTQDLLKTAPSRSSIVLAQAPALLFLAGWALSSYRAQHAGVVRVLSLDVVWAGACLFGIYALAIYLVVKTNDERLHVLVAWFLPVLPFLVAGEVSYPYLRFEVHETFWHALLPFVYWVTLQYSLYLARVTGTSQMPAVNSCASVVPRLVATAACAYRLFHTLWTRQDGDYRPPLVYQVLAFVLVAVASLEAAWEVRRSAPPLWVVNDKRS
jgi:hypothetical protein